MGVLAALALTVGSWSLPPAHAGGDPAAAPGSSATLAACDPTKPSDAFDRDGETVFDLTVGGLRVVQTRVWVTRWWRYCQMQYVRGDVQICGVRAQQFKSQWSRLGTAENATVGGLPTRNEADSAVGTGAQCVASSISWHAWRGCSSCVAYYLYASAGVWAVYNGTTYTTAVDGDDTQIKYYPL